MIRVSGLRISLDYNMTLLESIAAEKLGIDRSHIKDIEIVKRSLNNKNKDDIFFEMDIAVDVLGDEEAVLASKKSKYITSVQVSPYISIKKKLTNRPVVVGCGPAGMFAALILAEAGAEPVLLEQGANADTRRKKVLSFWETGILDAMTNVQFGEGGAGTFSDGKLKTGFKDARKSKILDELVRAGAPSEIKYLSKPHIGTDKLHETVKAIRKKTESLGGLVIFNATMNKLLLGNGAVRGVCYLKDGKEEELHTDNVVLAIGHSSRDTFRLLSESGVVLEQKPFAVGLRVEHTQELINTLQYGSFAGHTSLGAADYRMVVHLKNGRGVYTFCMCPGGTVVSAASEPGRLTTNGMSFFARDGKNANTALLVTVGREDLGSEHPLAGVEYQRRIEEAAFAAGGGGYIAPVQRLEDFMHIRSTKAFGDVLPTYLPGTSFAPVDAYMPDYITASLRQGIKEMADWMPGFYHPDAILTGAETRSSSPVRITRGENLEALGIKGLYPCGEGAGYAGGIISAAADGILCAEHILNKC